MSYMRTAVNVAGAVVLVAFLARDLPGPAHAQLTIIGPGSTVQGDILRGEGIFLNGAGLYNYYTAGANAINTDTWMRLNEYLYQSNRQAWERAKKRREEELQRKKDHHKKILDRIANSPE